MREDKVIINTIDLLKQHLRKDLSWWRKYIFGVKYVNILPN